MSDDAARRALRHGLSGFSDEELKDLAQRVAGERHRRGPVRTESRELLVPASGGVIVDCPGFCGTAISIKAPEYGGESLRVRLLFEPRRS